MFGKAEDVLDRHSMRGIAPWIGLIAIAFVASFFYGYDRTPYNRTFGGLAANTMYLVAKGSDIRCPGEVIAFRSETSRVRYIRPAIALAGAPVRVDGGPSIYGEPVSGPPDWLAKARDDMRGFALDQGRVPAGKLIAQNTEFEAGSKLNDWALRLIDIERVKHRFLFVLVSRDLTSIGRSVRPDPCREAR